MIKIYKNAPLFTPAQMQAMREISRDTKRVEDVRWWLGRKDGEAMCPISRSKRLSLYGCAMLCHKIWADLAYHNNRMVGCACPCHNNKPTREAFQMISEMAKEAEMKKEMTEAEFMEWMADGAECPRCPFADVRGRCQSVDKPCRFALVSYYRDHYATGLFEKEIKELIVIAARNAARWCRRNRREG